MSMNGGKRETVKKNVKFCHFPEDFHPGIFSDIAGAPKEAVEESFRFRFFFRQYFSVPRDFDIRLDSARSGRGEGMIRSRDKERGFTVKLIPLVQFLSRIGLYGRLPGLVVVHVIYGIPINLQPITVALQNLAGSQIVEWYVQMAGALLAALLIYIILSRFFIRGLLAGSGSSST
jgi:hypothetical protein